MKGNSNPPQKSPALIHCAQLTVLKRQEHIWLFPGFHPLNLTMSSSVICCNSDSFFMFEKSSLLYLLFFLRPFALLALLDFHYSVFVFVFVSCIFFFVRGLLPLTGLPGLLLCDWSNCPSLCGELMRDCCSPTNSKILPKSTNKLKCFRSLKH